MNHTLDVILSKLESSRNATETVQKAERKLPNFGAILNLAYVALASFLPLVSQPARHVCRKLLEGKVLPSQRLDVASVTTSNT